MRKLATAAVSYSATVFLSHYIVPPDFFIISAAVCALLSMLGIIIKGNLRRYLLLITIAAAMGFVVCGLSYHFKTLPAKALSDTELIVTAKVTEYPEKFDTYSTVTIRLTGDNTPKLNAVLYCFDDEIPELSPGDIISAKVKLKSADERNGKAYYRLNAENVYLLCYLNGQINVTARSPMAFMYIPKTLSKEIKAISQKVFSQKTAPLMTALLTGDTKLLYSDSVLYSQMAEAGTLHIVAVSGMNVAFLIGFIQLTVRRKKLASLIGIPIIILFVPFAGATPSVIRAACMQIMVLIAPLLKRENDGITSLATVLALMLLINPSACAGVSLQLSFAATLGIILFTPLIYKPISQKIRTSYKKSEESVLRKFQTRIATDVCAAFAATVGALVFSMPISAIYFGNVSVIGILVNVIVFWAISAAFILGYISCFLGMLWLPLGAAIGALTSLFPRFIIAVVQIAASLPYAAIYTKGNNFGYWLILLYLIFFVSYVFWRKKRIRLIIPVCLAVSSLCCIIIFTELKSRTDEGRIAALDVGQGQCIEMTSRDATVLIDCGGKAKSSNAGDTAAAYLLGNGRQSIDVLALTHFDSDHVNGVVRLMSLINVKRLVIPDGNVENAARAEILKIADEVGTKVYIIKEETAISINEIAIKVYPIISQEEYALMFLETMGEFDCLITGDADIDDENRFLESHVLPDAELFIVGHHGSKYSSGEQLLRLLKAEYAFVSCGYNSYGHPSEEALERLGKAGMKVCRTDQSGNVYMNIKGELSQLG